MNVWAWSVWLDAGITASALAVAVAVRPWRALATSGPPWPWLAWWAVLPVLWSVDGPSGNPIAQPFSGASLLVLMAGRPLAVLMLLPAALMTGWWAGLPPEAMLQRGVWLGVVPATLAMALGAGLRRWLPNHLFIYILGRGFFITTLAGALAALGQMLLHTGAPGLASDDLLLARVLTASGDAFITGLLVAMCVAYRPHWLATYADRIYLPRS
jgi:uncharacterized membrane protein